MKEDAMIKLLKITYSRFNDRNLPDLLKVMHPDVVWPNGMEGGVVYGHKGVTDYWTRQWSNINPKVDPVSFTREPDGRMMVRVHQLVKDLDGQVLLDRMVEHIYEFGDDLIIGMEIREVND
jgi:hypothetical protein